MTRRPTGPFSSLVRWSRSLGHENVLTTFKSYGAVLPHRQADLIKGMGLCDQAGSSLVSSVLSAWPETVSANRSEG